MFEAIRNAMAIRVLKRAGIFVEMRVVDRGGVAQTKFIVKHHGVTSCIGRRSAVQLGKTMERFRWQDEMKTLVWDK